MAHKPQDHHGTNNCSASASVSLKKIMVEMSEPSIHLLLVVGWISHFFQFLSSSQQQHTQRASKCVFLAFFSLAAEQSSRFQLEIGNVVVVVSSLCSSYHKGGTLSFTAAERGERNGWRMSAAPFSIFQDKVTEGINAVDKQLSRTGRRKAFTEETFLDEESGSFNVDKEAGT